MSRIHNLDGTADGTIGHAIARVVVIALHIESAAAAFVARSGFPSSIVEDFAARGFLAEGLTIDGLLVGVSHRSHASALLAVGLFDVIIHIGITFNRR